VKQLTANLIDRESVWMLSKNYKIRLMTV